MRAQGSTATCAAALGMTASVAPHKSCASFAQGNMQQAPSSFAIRHSFDQARRLRDPQSRDIPGHLGPESEARAISSSQFGRGGAPTFHQTRKSLVWVPGPEACLVLERYVLF